MEVKLPMRNKSGKPIGTGTLLSPDPKVGQWVLIAKPDGKGGVDIYRGRLAGLGNEGA